MPGTPEDLGSWEFNKSLMSLDFEISQAVFKSKLHHGLAEWPWANNLISSSFICPIYMWGFIIS